MDLRVIDRLGFLCDGTDEVRPGLATVVVCLELKRLFDRLL